jgi:membrane protein YdbS with pleckstrin-like domain
MAEPPPPAPIPPSLTPVPPVGAPFRPPGRIVRFLEPYLKLPIEPPKIPEGSAGARVFRAAPAFLKYRFTLLAFANLVEAHILVGIFGGAFALNAVVGVFVVVAGILTAGAILALAYAVIRLDYDLRQYVVTDRALRTRTGALTVSEATITFANVQDVEISQGPLQRWFGIADVLVHTAGGGSSKGGKHGGGGDDHRGAFVGIDRPKEVRDFILERIRAFRDAGLGDPDDPTHRAPAPTAVDLEAALTELRSAASDLRAAAHLRAESKTPPAA